MDWSRKFLWFFGFVCCTFLFVVLYEHGWSEVGDFQKGAREEFQALADLVRRWTDR